MRGVLLKLEKALLALFLAQQELQQREQESLQRLNGHGTQKRGSVQSEDERALAEVRCVRQPRRALAV